jgi:ATP phosphoribosyltransferase
MPLAISTISTIDLKMTTGRLFFAVPKKGRLHERCLKFLEAAGIEYTRPDRVDVAMVDNMPMTLVFLPAADIAKYVGEGNVDLGITGEDIIAESEVDVKVEMKLGFGKCTLALEVPAKHEDTPLSSYAGSRIVTSFPNVAKKFFEPIDAAAGATTSIRTVSGSVEAACGLGLADAVVDLVETGTTMRAAGLCKHTPIMESETVLISNPATSNTELVETIRARIQGYLDTVKYVLMTYNMPRERLTEAVKLTPGKKSPTLLPLEDPDWVSVSSMVVKKNSPEVMDELLKLGARDILVFSMDNCRV